MGDKPLLIGGATTSRTHTAVKIEPAFDGLTIYVPDASRAVGVVSGLLSPERRTQARAAVRDEYVKHPRAVRPRPRAEGARRPRAGPRQPLPPDFEGYTPTRPSFLGEPAPSTTTTWRHWPKRSTGRRSSPAGSWSAATPPSSRTTVVGEAARNLYADARPMLDRIVQEACSQASGVVGFWAANADGDDIILYTDDRRSTELARLHTLRQQMLKSGGKPNLALSDFIAPVGGRRTTWAPSPSPPATARARWRRCPSAQAGDDYSAILATTLADRLAEAFAEAMHAQGAPRAVGLCAGRGLGGGRPAGGEVPRHPPCARLSGPARPHREGHPVPPARSGRSNTGMALTESFAMARRPRSRASTSPTRRRTISASARSTPTRPPTTPAARVGGSRLRSAGWRRS